MRDPSQLLDLSFEELRETMAAESVGPGQIKSFWQFLHRLQPQTELPLALQSWLAEHLHKDVFIDRPEIVSDIRSRDGHTRKLLLRLADGHEIETVIMGYPGRHTVCLSTQVGCAMGCVFCATGQMGFVRHLRTGEIVAQALTAQRLLLATGPTGIRNLVMMGMGEPLHNYDAVIKALGILSDRRGMGIAESRITICTVGLVPQIEAEEAHDSIHDTLQEALPDRIRAWGKGRQGRPGEHPV